MTLLNERLSGAAVDGDALKRDEMGGSVYEDGLICLGKKLLTRRNEIRASDPK